MVFLRADSALLQILGAATRPFHHQRFHRALGDPQRDRDLPLREAFDFPQEKNFATPFGQRVDRGAQQREFAFPARRFEGNGFFSHACHFRDLHARHVHVATLHRRPASHKCLAHCALAFSVPPKLKKSGGAQHAPPDDSPAWLGLTKPVLELERVRPTPHLRRR
ncbi:MAG TPA: hypothetical protein VEQ65_03750, partial [Opitutus sp.]|nr:hypothetical protein [Opitutus sp.]